MPDLFTLADLGRASVFALWLPVLVWSVVAVLAEAALRASHAGAPLSLPIRGAVLAALPLAFALPASLKALAPDAARAVTALTTEVTWLPGIAVGAQPVDVAPTLSGLDVVLGLVVVAAIGLAGIRLAHVAHAAWRAHKTRRRLPSASAEAAAAVETARIRFGVTRAVVAVEGPADTPPFTLGWRRPVVALPPDLRPEALEVAAAHEVAHVRRADYAWHAVQQVVEAVFAAHPLVGVLGRGLNLDRERAVDAAVLTACPDRRRAYADLLFSYAALPAPPLALGAAWGSSSLKTRIDAMTRPLSPARARLFGHLGRLLGLVVLAAAVAGATLASPSPAVATVTSTLAAPADTTDVVEVADEMPVLIGGLEGLMGRVEYPELQRRAGVEGRTVLQFVVSTEGTVEQLVVARSSGNDGLDEAAMAAVRPSRFEPGRVDGEPVRVRFAVPITFRLPAEAETVGQAEPAPRPQASAPEGDPDVMAVVDEQPRLIGGLAGLQERVTYPPLARDAGIEGQVIVQFVVDEQGSVQDAVVLRSPDDMLSEAALRAIREARFEPGRQGGVAVKVRFAVPITFSLPEVED